MREIVSTFFSVLGLALLQGCTNTIALQPPMGALDFGFRGGAGRTVAVEAPFLDARDKSACEEEDGERKHAPERFKGRTPRAPSPSPHRQLNCNGNPPSWFSERLVTGLQGADFIVLERGAEIDAQTLQVRGTVHLLEAEGISLMQSAVFEADVHISLEVSTANGLRATRNFHAKGAVSRMGGAMGTLQEALDETSDRMIRDMTAAILSLSNRYSGRIGTAGEVDAAWMTC